MSGIIESPTGPVSGSPVGGPAGGPPPVLFPPGNGCAIKALQRGKTIRVINMNSLNIFFIVKDFYMDELLLFILEKHDFT
jgi:hypothetical protein